METSSPMDAGALMPSAFHSCMQRSREYALSSPTLLYRSTDLYELHSLYNVGNSTLFALLQISFVLTRLLN